MRLSASAKGADNREVLREIGRTDSEIDAMQAEGIVG
jgi:crotonobetainyl-CoA:carnitine CoA-transferase CaiB-like acyl-CoA transferase